MSSNPTSALHSSTPDAPQRREPTAHGPASSVVDVSVWSESELVGCEVFESEDAGVLDGEAASSDWLESGSEGPKVDGSASAVGSTPPSVGSVDGFCPGAGVVLQPVLVTSANKTPRARTPLAREVNPRLRSHGADSRGALEHELGFRTAALLAPSPCIPSESALAAVCDNRYLQSSRLAEGCRADHRFVPRQRNR